MNRIQQMLHAARWAYPALEWRVTSDDLIFAPEPEKYFDLYNPSTLTAVETKLFRELGWKIHTVTRNGKPHYEARGGERGSPDHPDRIGLILQLVPGHRGPSE